LGCALAHSAEEGFAYTLIQPGGEEQQVCILKQFVDNPCGVGIQWGGVITSSPPRAMRERSYHCVCTEDGYCGGLAVLLF
jgi:hypothetical protein